MAHTPPPPPPRPSIDTSIRITTTDGATSPPTSRCHRWPMHSPAPALALPPPSSGHRHHHRCAARPSLTSARRSDAGCCRCASAEKWASLARAGAHTDCPYCGWARRPVAAADRTRSRSVRAARWASAEAPLSTVSAAMVAVVRRTFERRPDSVTANDGGTAGR